MLHLFDGAVEAGEGAVDHADGLALFELVLRLHGLRSLGHLRGEPFDLEVLYPELDGTFPNHPADPIQPENQRDLCKRVREVGADIGFAFDGAADRVFVVDEQGIGLSGSTTTAIIAAGILDKHPGETVIHNLICSKAVPEVIAEHGGTAVRTRVGHSFIKEVMASTGAIFGDGSAGSNSQYDRAPEPNSHRLTDLCG